MNYLKMNENDVYDELYIVWENFYLENGRYPSSEENTRDKRIPERHKLKKILGSRYEEFKSYFKEKDKNLKYEKYCKVYIEESNKLRRPLSQSDLDAKNEYSNVLPSAKWFIDNSPPYIKTFRQFYQSLGFKRKDELSKEDVISLIRKKRDMLGRNLLSSDFDNSDLFNPEDVGFGAIWKFWGNFNNMMKELGYPVNQENMLIKSKSIKELLYDIETLCNYILKTENRKLISYRDIDDCKWCLSAQIYGKRFKKELNITLSEFIESIGFKPNNIGVGQIYKWDEKETTFSSFEYSVTKYLRDNNINYNRNVKYSEFSDYKGNKDCDYVINVNGIQWYVEIAGMVNNINDYSTNIKKNYIHNLKEKIKILESRKLNYCIIYAKDFKIKKIDSIMSFLHNNHAEEKNNIFG